MREILRLKLSPAGDAERSRAGSASRASTVRETFKRFEAAGLGWPLPDDMNDAELEAPLFAGRHTSEAIGAARSPTGPAFTGS